MKDGKAMTDDLVEIEREIERLHGEKARIIGEEQARQRAAAERKALEDSAEISTLVADINNLDGEMMDRLTKLFLLLQGGHGARTVRFAGGHIWSNCFHEDQPRRLGVPRHVSPMSRAILSIG